MIRGKFRVSPDGKTIESFNDSEEETFDYAVDRLYWRTINTKPGTLTGRAMIEKGITWEQLRDQKNRRGPRPSWMLPK